MTPEQKTKIREEFDSRFYQKNRVWISRGGESYGSITPEMGRAEMFRFIFSTIDSILAAKVEEIEKLRKEQLDKNDPDNYGACYAIGGFNDALSLAQDILKK